MREPRVAPLAMELMLVRAVNNRTMCSVMVYFVLVRDGRILVEGIGITRDTTTAAMFIETMDTMVIITLIALLQTIMQMFGLVMVGMLPLPPV
jgi:hypothetical protein